MNSDRRILPRAFLIFLLCLVVTACVSTPPSNRENICSIFRQKSGWYGDAVDAARRWKGPISVPMAIMAQESAFRANARPPMRFFLGFIPYGRPSDAFGYPQALDSTWAYYRQDAGSLFSQRDNFADAIDFIQWYMHKAYTTNQVDKHDAFNQYLNYHEGFGGFRRGTWKNKGWLIGVARRVEQRAQTYHNQIMSCKPELDKTLRGWWNISNTATVSDGNS